MPVDTTAPPRPAAPAAPAPLPVAAAAPLPAAQIPPAAPKSQTNERVFNLSGFTGIALSSSVDVRLEEGAFSVVATGTQELLDRLDIKTASNLLAVGMNSGNRGMRKDQHLMLTVRMPRVEQLIVQGSGSIHATPLTNSPNLELSVMGSGDINLVGTGKVGTLTINVTGSGDVACVQVDASKATVVNVTGSGDVNLSGRSDRLQVNVVGSGDVKAEGLTAMHGEVNLSGSGDVFMGPANSLQVVKMGSGDVHTTGATDVQTSPEDDGGEE